MKPPDKKPTQAEFGQLRAKLAQQGFSQAQIDSAVGKTNDLTRHEVVEKIIAWLRQNDQ